MLREVERAKVEAQNAKASEAAAQRKLADAEATLQRVREHATRATAEAERAKADTKAARESEETAKRNLADSEAAKVAAEVREQACHSAAIDRSPPTDMASKSANVQVRNRPERMRCLMIRSLTQVQSQIGLPFA